MERSSRDFGASPFLERLGERIAALPRMRWTALALAAIAIAAITLAPQPFWENDLSRLTPVPRDLLLHGSAAARGAGHGGRALSARRRRAGQRGSAAQARSAGAIAAGTRRAVASSAASITPRAMFRVRRHSSAASSACRIPPRYAKPCSARRPARRSGPDVFEPFVQDVEQARALQPLTVEASALLAARSQRRHAAHAAERRCHGARDAQRRCNDVATLQQFATEVRRQTCGCSTSRMHPKTLVAAQRTRILWTLAAAAVLLVAVVAFALRSRSRVFRVLAPMVLTTLLVLAVLRASGVSLTLFHLIALILAAGPRARLRAVLRACRRRSRRAAAHAARRARLLALDADGVRAARGCPTCRCCARSA